MKKFNRQLAQIERCTNNYALAFVWFTLDKSDLYYRQRLLDARAMQMLLIEARCLLSSKQIEHE